MRNPDREKVFRFKRFEVKNHLSAMKVGTDGVLLGAWALSGKTASPGSSLPEEPHTILDVGCGTGLIALMMAQRFPAASISAVEIDRDAAAEATDNFRNSQWSERLSLTIGDFSTEFPPEYNRRFDLIVSNPPFFTNGEISPEQSRLMARHEKSLTLETLIATSRRLLSPQGALCLILPADREDDLKFQAVSARMAITSLTRVTTVPSKPPRRILAELRDISACDFTSQAQHLSIHDGKGGFTVEYSRLVTDFYLHF